MKLALIGLFLFNFTAQAGLYMEWEGSNGGKYFYTKGKAKTLTTQGESIIDYNKGLLYQIDRKKKTIQKTDIKSFNDMMQSLSGAIETTNTKKTKKINGKKCHLVTVSFMGNKTHTCEIHYSKLGISKNVFSNFAKDTKKMINNASGFFNLDKGMVPIETVTTVMGKTNRTTLKKVQEKNIPLSTFNLPKGFKHTKAKHNMPTPEQMNKMKDILKKFKLKQ